ncbi:MAG: response regulator [Geothermobacteraceae bacterium]
MGAYVLIVDDDNFIRRILADLLQERGFTVLEAESGERALELCRDRRPQAVILDLVMPGVDGAEVCRTLRADPTCRYLPILLLTSRADRAARINPFELGADDYLAKPFDPEDLVTRLKTAIFKQNAQEAMAVRTGDYRALVDISESIADSVETGQILRRIVGKIAGHISDIERCSIAVIQEDSAVGYVLASSDDASVEELRFDLDNYPEIRRVLETGEPLLVSDVDRDPLLDPVRGRLANRQFNAILVVPVHHQQRVVGVMVLRALRSRPTLSPREIEFCQLVADVASGPLCNARFFTRLRRESAALRQAKQLLEDELRIKAIYEELFDNASDGLIAVNSDGLVEFANRRALQLIGFDRDDLVGQFLQGVVGRTTFGRVLVGLQRRGRSDGTDRVRFDLAMPTAHAGRRLFSVSANASPVLGNLYIVAIRDVSEKRRMERELTASNRRLQQLDRFRAEFLNTATHELRVPVTIVHGYCSLLRDSLGNGLRGAEAEYLQAACDSSEKLVDLVNNMLDLSRFEAGKMGLELLPRPIEETVREVCRELAPVAEQSRLTIQVGSVPGRPVLHDRHTVQRVIANLLSNAFKFTPEGGRVEIEFEEVGQDLLVSVSDTGKGIPPEQLPHLFDEFTQVGREDARRGSGLGLSICRKIVESHGGRIWAESQPGMGSRFCFTLPLAH